MKTVATINVRMTEKTLKKLDDIIEAENAFMAGCLVWDRDSFIEQLICDYYKATSAEGRDRKERK